MGRWALVVLAICAIGIAVMIGMRGSSSATNAYLGDWVEPIPGMEDQVQGFSLREDGVAESIDMATLQYRHWRVEAESLVLSGESIGNGATSDFEETYRVVSVDDKRLELIDPNGEARTYARR